jgi:hypothetical protein
MHEIKWDNTAIHQFTIAISYIGQNSPANADKVKREIWKK